MSNYTKATNFATKDSLPTGSALKIVSGTEIDTEFSNIETAVNTKANTSSPTFTGDIGMPNNSIDLEMMNAESVNADKLHISNAGTNGQYLQKQSGNAGGLTWGTVDLTTLSGANLTSGIIPTDRINASSIANDLLDSQHYAAGSIDNEHISGMAASKLTGALPAISGASLTNLPAPSLLATAGGVGSYMVASNSSHSTTARAAGYTFAGSLLKHRWQQPSTGNPVYPSDFSGGGNNSQMQSAGVGGTWKAMHPFRAGVWTSYWTYPIVLCQRIA